MLANVGQCNNLAVLRLISFSDKKACSGNFLKQNVINKTMKYER